MSTPSNEILAQAAVGSISAAPKLTTANYDHTILRFRDRQAGVSVIFDHERDRFTYNAYCLETVLLKELFTCEYDFLEDALEVVNSEFGTWESVDLGAKENGCGSCAAKR
jgi:hypothetical protein